MRLQEIMSRPVETVGPDVSAGEAWGQMSIQGIQHLVVVDDGRIIGVLSSRDLGGGRGGAGRRESALVREVMTPQAVTASARTTVREAANLLRGRTIGCLPVVERGKLVGMVTVSDLLDLVSRGAERPVAASTRWTLKHRGPRRQKTIQHTGYGRKGAP